MPGCGPESGCDKVLSSRWAYVFGLPVSIFAIPAYLALLGLVRPGRVRWNLVFPLALLVLFAALWFVGVQTFQLRAFCKFCMTAHAAGVLAALLLLKNAPLPAVRPAFGVAFALAGVAALAAVQTFGPERGPKQIASATRSNAPVPAATNLAPLAPSSTSTSPTPSSAAPAAGTNMATNGLIAALATNASAVPTTASARSTKFTIIDGRFTLDVTQLPISGPVDAPKRMAKLFDYTCKHCRDLQHLLRDFRRKYPDQLVVVSLPLPLDSNCNPAVKKTPPAHEGACAYARLGLAVFHANPAKFEEFTEWIYEPERPPEISAAKAYAEKLVGSSNLEEALRNPAIDNQIRADVNIYLTVYRLVKSGNLPQLYFEEGSSIGAIETSVQLEKVMAENLGFPAPGK